MTVPQRLRRAKRTLEGVRESAEFRFRQATCSRRALPGLIIVGAQKSGTTSLYHYLSQHPALRTGFEKEVQYFSGGGEKGGRYAKGEAFYRSFFHLDAGRGHVAYEASPRYLLNPLSAERIARDLPDVKIVAVLRDPVDRAISGYKMARRRLLEKLACDAAMRAEEQRIADALARQDYNSPAFIHHTYKTRGLYKEQLERYYQHFSEDQILVLGSQDLTQQASLDAVTDLIGVERYAFDLGRKYHWSRSYDPGTRQHASCGPETEQYLIDFFRPHNQELYAFLGRDFGWKS